MRFLVEIAFPGTDWAKIRDVVEYHDREGIRGEHGETTALAQVEAFVRTQEKRYAKYGADVSWAPYAEEA